MPASNDETPNPTDRWARAVCEGAPSQDAAGHDLEEAARIRLFGGSMTATTQQDLEGRHLEDQAFAGLFGGPAPAALARRQIGKYLLGEALGSGGMGEVFLALDTELGRKAAIKVLRVNKQDDPLERSRLLREAQALATLSDENVVRVHDSGLYEDRVYIAMEYVEGCTLRAWQDAAHRSWREVLGRYLAAGKGLAAIHAAGLVHRDFKPQNVLVSVRGEVKITDFGLAVTPGARSSVSGGEVNAAMLTLLATQLTASAVILGTPLYVSPEQLSARPLDARSDQFSFCVALYEALYGGHPYAESEPSRDSRDSRALTEGRTSPAAATLAPRTPSMMSLVAGLIEGRLRRPKKLVVPRRVYRAIERGLAREPGERFPSMPALLAALSRDPLRKYGPWVGVAGLSAMIGAAVFIPGALGKCKDIAADFQGAWSPARAEAVERAFLATDSPHAKVAAAQVKQTLDEYQQQWLASRADNCDAAHDRATQTAEVSGRRMTCLDHARDTLAATVAQLTHADARAVESVRDALTLLPSLAQCDAAFQTRQTCLDAADDPQLREQLDEARALEIAGKLVEAEASAAAVLAQASEHPRLRAEAELLRGRVFAESSRSTAADASFAAAYHLAEGAGCDALAFEAATRRTKLIALSPDLPASAGLAWSEVARSKLETLPTSGSLEADFHNDLGLLLQHRDDLPGARAEQLAQAREEHGQALALRKQVAGDRDTPELAISYLNLGDLETAGLRYELGLVDLQRSLEIYTRVYGPEHPALWKPHYNLGTAFVRLDRLPEARAEFSRALALAEAGLGTQNGTLGQLQFGLARVASYTDPRGDETLRLATTALKTYESKFQENDPERAALVVFIGQIHTDRNEVALALPYREEAVRRLSHAGAEERAYAHLELGNTLYELRRTEEADDQRHLARALASELEAPPAGLMRGLEALTDAIKDALDASSTH